MYAVKQRRAVRIGGHALHRARGFSLIEVLIALLILAFGLLGLAFLQVLNVRYTQSAQQRTIATNLAYELLDLIRINQVASDQYDGLAFDASSVAVPPGGCDRASGAVDSSDAASNIARWQCEVVDSLPAGRGAVTVAADGVTTVTIAWSDDVGRADDSNTSAQQSTSFTVVTRI
jgi:type IV pilus assembly protein PilV